MHVPYRAADLVFMHEHGSCMRNDERVRAECACVFVLSRTFCSLASLTSASRMCVTSSGSLDERMCKIAFTCQLFRVIRRASIGRTSQAETTGSGTLVHCTVSVGRSETARHTKKLNIPAYPACSLEFI